MRYILYLFTLGLVFTAGMLVGNFYIPTRNASLAAAVSVPDLDRVNPALDEATLLQTQRNIAVLTQALSSCPVVVEAERDRLFKQISLFLALQDFELKKSAYEAEIAKNARHSRPTARFSEAAAAYSEAKNRTEQLADELFPMQVPQPTQASSTTVTQASSMTATQPSSATAAQLTADNAADAAKQVQASSAPTTDNKKAAADKGAAASKK